MKQRVFRFGEWTVDVAGNALSQDDVRIPLEPRAMDVLRYLCRHPGAVIPAEEILQACWGTAELGDNPIHKAIAQLRRALGDSSTEPRYIETVRKRGYRALADVVEEEEQAGIWQDGSPFRGLEAFEESHAAIFFGRMQATTRLRETVLSQVDNGSAMALVLGPSGSGKTSLVRAGLLPQLSGGDGPVALSCLLHMDCADLGGGDLFGALAAVLVDAELDGVHLFDGSSAETLAGRLRSEPAPVAAQLSAVDGPVRIAVFVDRLEAIFRAPNTSDADRARFIGLLDVLATHRVLVMLACRNDFYPELIALPELMALKARGGHFDLEPPDGADIAQMVRLPARAAGLTFEIDPATGASLDDVLCDEARGSPDALPLLQYCLNELYRQRSEDGVLRFEVFRQLGGIEGALGVRAEQIFAGLPGEQQAALPHVLTLVVSVGEEQNAVTARRSAWSALRGDAERSLAAALVEARLFVSELTGDEASFGAAHEALLRRWPRVVEWIERHREALQIRTRFAAQANRWLVAGKPNDLLLPRGSQLIQAQKMLEVIGSSIPSAYRLFIQSSVRRSRTFAHLRMALLCSLLVLFVLSIVLGLTARSEQRRAELHRSAAEGLMTYTLGEFVEKLRPLGRMELLDSVSHRALSYLSETPPDAVDNAALTQRAKALQLIAEVQIARADSATATEALHAAKRVLGQLDRRGAMDKTLLLALGANAFWLGQIALDKGELPIAREHFTEYLAITKRLVATDQTDPKGWVEESYAHSSLGTVALTMGLFTAAAAEFQISVQLKRRALTVAPDATIAADLANSISWIASTKVKLGELKAATALYQEEEQLLRPLYVDDPANAVWAYRLAISLWHSAELHAALGQAERSHALFAETMTLLDKLIEKDASNRMWQIDRLKVELKDLSLYSTTRTNIPGKLRRLERFLADLNEADGGNVELSKAHAFTLQLKAQHFLDIGRLEDAGSTIRAAVSMLSKLKSGKHNDIPLLASLTTAMLAQADIELMEGNIASSKSICQEVQKLLIPVVVNGADYNLLVPLAKSYKCTASETQLADLRQRLTNIGYADPKFMQSLSTTKKGT